MTEQDRQARLEEEMKRLREWPNSMGFPVVVETASGKVETWTTTMARMFGDMAVVNVHGVDGAVPLSKVTIVPKESKPEGGQ
jgi:hypothetical protein